MANLIQKDGIYVVRFRFKSKEYERSLKTRDKTAADAQACRGQEHSLTAC